MKLKRDRPSDEIPTSSMADIAFLLIIYFMVTTTFTATRGLDFAPPKDDDNPPVIEKEESVLIEITDDLVIDLADLQAKLKTAQPKAVLLSNMRGHLVDMEAVSLDDLREMERRLRRKEKGE